MVGEIDFGALKTPDFFGNALRSQALGQQAAMQRDRRNALSGYGADPVGSISQLAMIDPEAASNLSKLHQTDVTSQGRARAAQMAGHGDLAGAQGAALEIGDEQLMNAVAKMDEGQRARKKEHAGTVASLLYGLKKLPYEQRKARLAELTPHAAEYDLSPEEIQAVDPTDAVIDAKINSNLGLAATIAEHNRLSKPNWKERTNPDGSTEWFDIDAEGGAHEPQGGPSATPMSSPTGGDQQYPGAPRSVRNNNPGNIEDGDFARSLPGYKGSDGRFAIFDSPDAGDAAQTQLLQSYGRRGFNNVKAIIERWAPKSDGNDTQAYIDFVARNLGVSPREVLNLDDPAVVGQVAAAIKQFEGGPATKEPAQPYEVAANGETSAPPRIRGSAPKPAKEMVRPATAQEKAALGIPEDVPAQRRADGSIDVISGVATHAKAPPPKIQAGYIANNTTLQQIDQAIAQLEKNPHAMGLMNNLGDEFRQRTDQGGISTRAAVARVGAVQIHDLSGAAVTASETPRLKPFIPMPTDTAEAAIIKLRQMREMVESNNSQIEVAYGPDSGYSPIGSAPKGETLPPQARSQLKEGHVTTFGNGQKWTLKNGQPVRAD